MIHIRRVLRAVKSTPWAILPDKLEEILALVDGHDSGIRYTAEEVQARIGSPPRAEPKVAGSTAVIPLHGVIAQRANVTTEISGGTSTERFRDTLRGYLADPDVSSIVLDIDSPGGTVFGVAELAAEIRKMRGRKPIVAVANSLAASAAYWIGSQASEFVVTPSGLVGSIGVIAVHTDVSKAEEMEGFKTTPVTAGKYKAEGSEFEPLGEEARAEMQSRVDSYYGMFVRDVAAGRGVHANVVLDSYGEGRVVTADKAVSLGMADRIATLDQVIAKLSRQPASRSMSASDAVEIAAEEPAAAPPTAEEPPAAPKKTTPLELRLRQLEAFSRGPRISGEMPEKETLHHGTA